MLGATASLTVNNVAPSNPAISLSEADISENGSVTLTGAYTDPGTGDMHAVTVNWGPGETPTTVTLPVGQRTFAFTHRYLDDNPGGTKQDNYTIAATVADDDLGPAAAPAIVTVKNVAPTLSDLVVTPAIDENGVATLSGAITDPGTRDTFTLDVYWADGSAQRFGLGATALARASAGIDWNPATRQFVVDHRYLDDAPTGDPSNNYGILVNVIDDDEGESRAQTSVTVRNVAPAGLQLQLDNTTVDETR